MASRLGSFVSGEQEVSTDTIAAPKIKETPIADFGDVGVTGEEFAEQSTVERNLRLIGKDILDVANAVQVLPALAVGGVQKLTSDDPEAGQTAFNFAERIHEFSSDLAGVPRDIADIDPVDQATAFAVEALVPVGLAGKAISSISNSSKAAKAMKAVSGFLQGTKGGRLGKFAGRTTELLTPFSLPFTPTNIGLNAGIAIGVDTGVRELVGADSLISDAQAEIDEQTGIERIDPVETVQEELKPEARTLSEFAADNKLIDRNEDTTWDTISKIGIFALVAGGAAGAAYSLMRRTALRGGVGTPKAIDGAQEFTRDFGEKVANASTKTVDPFSNITEQVARVAGKDVAEQFDDAMALNTRLAGAQRAEFTLRTGQFPDSKVAGPSMRRMMEAFGSITTDEQKLFNEGISAMNALEGRALKENLFPQFNTTELRRRITQMNANPKIKELSESYWELGRSALKYAHESGLFTDEATKLLSRNRAHYMPVDLPHPGSIDGAKDWLRLFVGDESLVTRNENFIKHLLARQKGGEGLTEVMPPMESMQNYIAGLVTFAQKNKVQRDIVDLLVQGGKEAPELAVKRVQMSAKAAEKASDRVLGIRRNGLQEFYKFEDPMVKTAMEFSPYAANKYLGWMRRIAQSGYTGVLNPAFAPKSLIWDGWYGAVTRPASREFGYLDRLAQFSTKDRFGIPGDPTAIFSSVIGAGRDAGAQFSNEISRIAYASLDSGGLMSKVFGRQMTQVVADRMRDSYARSYRAMLEQGGAYNSGWLSDPVSGMNSLIARDSPLYRGSIPVMGNVVRYYKGALEAMHNGSRTAFFAQNLRKLNTKHKGNVPQEALQSLLADTRKLSGDFARSGLGDTYRSIADSVPYANVTVQATKHYADAFRKSPQTALMGTFNAGMTMIGGVALMSSMSDAHHDYWWNRVPAWQRATHVPIPLDPTDPTNTAMIPVAPELAVAMQIAVEGADAAFGFSDGRFNDEEFSDLKDAVYSMVGLMPPPLINAIAGSAGYRIDTGQIVANAVGDNNARPVLQSTSAAPGNPEETRLFDSHMSDNVSLILASILGTAGVMAATGYETAQQGQENDTSGLGEAVSRIGYEYERRLPFSQLWGVHKATSSSSVSDVMHSKMRVIDQVEKEFGAVFGGLSGNETSLVNPEIGRGPRDIPQELLQPLGNVFIAFVQNPVMSQLRQQRSRLRKQLRLLESDLAANAYDAQDDINLMKDAIFEVESQIVQEIQSKEELTKIDLIELESVIKSLD